MGLGDALQRSVPVQLPEITDAGQVCCGFNHTLVLSRDGSTVWSFGAAENGKLGHGDTQRQFRPKVIESLQGLSIRKIASGTQISCCITHDGVLYTWGFGPCLGNGTNDETALSPRIVVALNGKRVVDITIGENHIIALTNDSQVYAWGNNQNGQCGMGTPIATFGTPQLITGLANAPIKQVSAGTTHSIVWCSAPADGIGFSQQKPFSLDIHPRTRVENIKYD